MAGFLDESGRIPFCRFRSSPIHQDRGQDFRVLDLLVPKSLETVAWQQRQWFDWNGSSYLHCLREGIVEMKRAAGRDLI